MGSLIYLMNNQNQQSNSHDQYPGEITSGTKSAVLNHLLDIFRQAETFSRFIENLSSFLCREFHCQTILFSLYDLDRKELEYIHPPFAAEFQIHPNPSPAASAIESGKIFSTQELDKFPNLQPLHSHLGNPVLIRACPLVCRNKLLGAVELVYAVEQGKDDPASEAYLEVVCAYLGLFINDFSLYEQAARMALVEEKLADVSEKISSSLDLDELLDNIIQALYSLVPCDAAGIFLLEKDNSRIHRMLVYGYRAEVGQTQLLELGEKTNEMVRRSGQAMILRDLLYQPAYLRVTESSRAAMLAPILSNHRRIGVFTLESSTPDAYTLTDLELFKRFSLQAALSIEKAQLYQALLDKNKLEKELSIAREIQTSFLPSREPDLPGFDLAGMNIPSRLVSGDYYDFIQIVEGQWGIVVGDVSGKGIPASLIMASFRASLLAEIRNNYAISVIMSKVNRLLWESTAPHQFVTAFYGVLDLGKRLLTFSNAGHNPGLILHENGALTILEVGGLVLGAFPESTYEESYIGLIPGDILVLYTDGVTEIYNEEGEEFGVERLQKLVTTHRDLTASQMAQNIKQEILDYAPDRAIQDDFTLMILKTLPI